MINIISRDDAISVCVMYTLWSTFSYLSTYFSIGLATTNNRLKSGFVFALFIFSGTVSGTLHKNASRSSSFCISTICICFLPRIVPISSSVHIPASPRKIACASARDVYRSVYCWRYAWACGK